MVLGQDATRQPSVHKCEKLTFVCEIFPACLHVCAPVFVHVVWDSVCSCVRGVGSDPGLVGGVCGDVLLSQKGKSGTF